MQGHLPLCCQAESVKFLISSLLSLFAYGWRFGIRLLCTPLSQRKEKKKPRVAYGERSALRGFLSCRSLPLATSRSQAARRGSRVSAAAE